MLLKLIFRPLSPPCTLRPAAASPLASFFGCDNDPKLSADGLLPAPNRLDADEDEDTPSADFFSLFFDPPPSVTGGGAMGFGLPAKLNAPPLELLLLGAEIEGAAEDDEGAEVELLDEEVLGAPMLDKSGKAPAPGVFAMRLSMEKSWVTNGFFTGVFNFLRKFAWLSSGESLLALLPSSLSAPERALNDFGIS